MINKGAYKQLKGYTLVELLFVIMLTSIIVFMTFVYFNSIQKYVLSQSDTADYELEVMRFESVLNFDLDRAQSLSLDGRFLVCHGIEVEYELAENYIIREHQNVHDSLYAQNIYFEVDFYEDDERLPQEIMISILDHTQNERVYYFRKDYDVYQKLISFQRNVN